MRGTRNGGDEVEIRYARRSQGVLSLFPVETCRGRTKKGEKTATPVGRWLCFQKKIELKPVGTL